MHCRQSVRARAPQSAILGFGAFQVLERYGFRKLSVGENVILQTTSVATATMPLAAGAQLQRWLLAASPSSGTEHALMSLPVSRHAPRWSRGGGCLRSAAHSCPCTGVPARPALAMRVRCCKRRRLREQGETSDKLRLGCQAWSASSPRSA